MLLSLISVTFRLQEDDGGSDRADNFKSFLKCQKYDNTQLVQIRAQ